MDGTALGELYMYEALSFTPPRSVKLGGKAQVMISFCGNAK